MSRRIPIGPFAGLLLLSGPAFGVQTDVEPPVYTNPFDEVTNFNVETVRGMDWDSLGRLWAINTHGSTLVRFDGAFTGPEEIFHTVNNPVAMDIWSHGGLDFPIVGGGGTHAVVRHESISGTVLALAETPSEVGDLVVDHDSGNVFVSCPGANVVLQLSLPSLDEVRRIEIPSIRPRFLFLDEGAEEVEGDSRVYVAPFLSGNNSVMAPLGTSHAGQLVDGRDPAIVVQGLPDEDLFRIDPVSGSVSAVLTDAGTLLTAHGLHPDGDYWMLSVDANNVQLPSEPLVNGKASFNKLKVWTPSGTGFTPSLDVDLDDTAPPAASYQSAFSASFPFALEFHDFDTGIIASSTGDRLIEVSASGTRLGSYDLPEGGIPRDLLFDEDGETLYVYLWGTNEILRVAYPFQVPCNPPFTGSCAPVSLGLDPTPESIKRGREIWYDADRSEHARSSCNSCHPAGGTDNLAWNLENAPLDHKGVLTTQSLLSIEDTFPYHWRGERNLEHFNAAFPDLLGAPGKLQASDFQDLQAFIFSLQAPANPNQAMGRLPDPTLTAGPYPDLRFPPEGPHLGDAVLGQQIFENKNSFFGAVTCVSCHISQSGGLGEMILERGSVIPEAAHLDVAHLRQLKNKEMPSTPLVFHGVAPGTLVNVERPLTGFAFTHDGLDLNINEFLSGVAFHLDGIETAHVTSFVRQFDQGIAPAAHAAVSMRFGNAVEAFNEVNDLLVKQAKDGWIDVAVRGRVTTSGGPIDMGWVYNPATNEFESSDPGTAIVVGSTSAMGNLTLFQFAVQAVFGTGSFVFYGLPPGNGERFGIDADNDQLADGVEVSQHGTNPWDPDSDDDGNPDGYEIVHGSDPKLAASVPDEDTPPGQPTFKLDYVTARGANLFVEFDEPVTYTVTYSTPGGPLLDREQLDPVRKGTLMLQEMQPSSIGFPEVYGGSITVTDLSNNPSTYPIPSLTTRNVLNPAVPAVTVKEFFWSVSPTRTVVGADGNSTLTGTATVQLEPVDANDTLEVFGRVVILQVLTKEPTEDSWAAKDAVNVPASVPALAFFVHPGPLLVSDETDDLGQVSIPIQVHGLTTTEELKIKVVAVLKPSSTAAGGLEPLSAQAYQMPATLLERRTLDE